MKVVQKRVDELYTSVANRGNELQEIESVIQFRQSELFQAKDELQRSIGGGCSSRAAAAEAATKIYCLKVVIADLENNLQLVRNHLQSLNEAIQATQEKRDGFQEPIQKAAKKCAAVLIRMQSFIEEATGSGVTLPDSSREIAGLQMTVNRLSPVAQEA